MKTVPVAPVVTSESKTSSSADLPGAKKTESKGCYFTDEHNIASKRLKCSFERACNRF